MDNFAETRDTDRFFFVKFSPINELWHLTCQWFQPFAAAADFEFFMKRLIGRQLL